MKNNFDIEKRGITSSVRQYFTHAKSSLDKMMDNLYEEGHYKKNFESSTGLKFYRSHIAGNFISCAFCSNLMKAACHNYCFKCRRGIYDDCNTLLPGTFSFISNLRDSSDNNTKPWLFKTPCTFFERAMKSQYYRNFISNETSVTAENFETLEGLFAGIVNGNRPCHICAAVNMQIYKRCRIEERTDICSPCDRIMKELTAEYKSMPGIIKLAR